MGGPPAGNQLNAATEKQLNQGKVLPRRNTDSAEEEEVEVTSPQKNQTREIGKEYIEFPITLMPLLQLHSPIPNTDGQGIFIFLCKYQSMQLQLSESGFV